jgi:hypothetical protein
VNKWVAIDKVGGLRALKPKRMKEKVPGVFFFAARPTVLLSSPLRAG